MERQDYSKLQTRKVKGLKKRKFEQKQGQSASGQPPPKQIKQENGVRNE